MTTMTMKAGSTRGKLKGGLAVAALLLTLQGAALAEAQNPNHWLRNVPDDAARFERLENYLGGFSSAMWEVGERYRHVHEALEAYNLDLARYHWEKIRGAIRGGYMKRPARQPNADQLFLDTAWPVLQQALEDDDGEAARRAFNQARTACMACHVAERVPFMNDQPLFRDRVFGD